MGKLLFIDPANKEAKEKFIKDVTNIINEYYEKKAIDEKKKKPDRHYNAEDLIKKSEDKNRIEKYKNFLMLEDKNNKLSKYGKELEKKLGVKVLPGFTRNYMYYLNIPEENNPNKEEIEKKNEEFMRSVSDPAKLDKTIHKMIKDVMTSDLTIFFPENPEEALETAMNNNCLLQTSFVVDTIYSNNGVSPSTDYKKDFNYCKTTIQNGANITNMVNYGKSEAYLFFPEDIPFEDFMAMSTQLNNLAENVSNPEKEPYLIEKNSLKQVDTFTSLMNYYGYLATEGEFDKYTKNFFKKHNKNHDFLFKHNIGGISLKEGLQQAFNQKKEPKILDNSPEVEKNFDKHVIPVSINDIYDEYLKKDKIMKNIESDRVKLDTFTYNTGEKMSERASLLFTYFAASSVQGEKAQQLADGLKEKIDKCGINKKQIDAFRQMYDGEMPFDDITDINNNGFVFADPSKELTYCKDYSINELKNAFNDSYENNDYKTKSVQFLATVKEASNRYNSRGFLSKIFSPTAWKENSIIKDAKKIMTNNGINKKDFETFLNNKDENFNKLYGSFMNGGKEEVIEDKKTAIKINSNTFEKFVARKKNLANEMENTLDNQKNNDKDLEINSLKLSQ